MSSIQSINGITLKYSSTNHAILLECFKARSLLSLLPKGVAKLTFFVRLAYAYTMHKLPVHWQHTSLHGLICMLICNHTFLIDSGKKY